MKQLIGVMLLLLLLPAVSAQFKEPGESGYGSSFSSSLDSQLFGQSLLDWIFWLAFATLVYGIFTTGLSRAKFNPRESVAIALPMAIVTVVYVYTNNITIAYFIDLMPGLSADMPNMQSVAIGIIIAIALIAGFFVFNSLSTYRRLRF